VSLCKADGLKNKVEKNMAKRIFINESRFIKSKNPASTYVYRHTHGSLKLHI
jgi:hypothetical protein